MEIATEYSELKHISYRFTERELKEILIRYIADTTRDLVPISRENITWVLSKHDVSDAEESVYILTLSIKSPLSVREQLKKILLDGS
jgi:hypothetical protein